MMKTMTAKNKLQLLSTEEQEAITAEIKTLIQDMRQGMEQLDAEASFKNFITSPEFNYISIHGKVLDHAGLLKEANEVFVPAQKAQYNFRIEHIKVLSREAVLATYISSGTFFFPDSSLHFPDCATSLVWVKREDAWKVLQMQESVQESEFVQTMLES
ncbi:nuclear transport factor 2 family protein [Carboxylicivirga mesophila]|uniref:Nuclear transport factor 2 family protein n=1 Tax=Carboxylicivirga mesophila TaxID=1166478 RepID=A0ABS5KG59_9BACT|nr:nuclear transport factor 2 family protein [Carboxylicivirga mesophila]MBS2213852.1 nuclear transport factor 2 family protein [Carboxylicivirga mesophila]